jgi:uncharacterized integral membrane protein (TIGR00698 family)
MTGSLPYKSPLVSRIAPMIFWVLAALCLLPQINPALALIMGIALACLLGAPYETQIRKSPKILLPLCVASLGAGMNLFDVLDAGLSGLGYTAVGIVLAMAIGITLTKLFKADAQTGLLISAGTAICGGSAIAALAPAIAARPAAIAVSLAVIFSLNALALILFPPIGHALSMDQHAFGLWSALAIHDTSSVVGAGLAYGEEALQTGTSVKLARALWIVPLVMVVSHFYARKVDDADRPKPKFPWFIIGFIALAALVTFFPILQIAGDWIAFSAKRGLVLTLFLIGCSLNIQAIKTVGWRPLALGLVLWLIVAATSLVAIQIGIIR